MNVILFLVLFMGHQAFADIYRYVDDNGQVSFTDKPAEGSTKVLVKPNIDAEKEYIVPDIKKYNANHQASRIDNIKILLKSKRDALVELKYFYDGAFDEVEGISYHVSIKLLQNGKPHPSLSIISYPNASQSINEYAMKLYPDKTKNKFCEYTKLRVRDKYYDKQCYAGGTYDVKKGLNSMLVPIGIYHQVFPTAQTHSLKVTISWRKKDSDYRLKGIKSGIITQKTINYEADWLGFKDA